MHEDVVIARNPATGAELARLAATSPAEVAGLVERAREAQALWGRTNWRERRAVLDRWRRVLARDAVGWADAILQEIGKPRGEAMGEVVAALDSMRWTARNAGRALADERIGPGWQRCMLIPPARLCWRPFGVVGMIGTWNYPLFLNAPTIAQALAAGNAVVWKPSEHASFTGDRLRRGLEEAGAPANLATTLFGGPEVGRALIGSGIDKGLFTGGIEQGRLVLGELGRRGVPAVAELSGFDAAIVLPDAPREPTARALTWASFVGAGQTCIALKRVYVVGDPVPRAEAMAEHARAIRVGDPAGSAAVDIGPMISAQARDRFDVAIRAAIGTGARVLAGGGPMEIEGSAAFYKPTVLLAETDGPEAALSGTFGPVVVVRGVADADEAIRATNASPYGLAASVWGRDRRAARLVADRLEAGMISINDAVTPSAHAPSPFGGCKASGFGRTHGALGLREFAQPRTTHSRSTGGYRPHLFPYSARLEQILAIYRALFHRASS